MVKIKNCDLTRAAVEVHKSSTGLGCGGKKNAPLICCKFGSHYQSSFVLLSWYKLPVISCIAELVQVDKG